MNQTSFTARHPRRKFLAGFCSAVAGIATAIVLPKRARAQEKSPPATDTGPVLYRRTEEAERYYRTLYR
jgi:hypothetical protein